MKLLLNLLFVLTLFFIGIFFVCYLLVGEFGTSLLLNLRLLPYTIFLSALVFGLIYTKPISYGEYKYIYVVLAYIIISVIITAWAWFYGEFNESWMANKKMHQYTLIRQDTDNRLEYLHADTLELKSDYLRYNWQNNKGELQSYNIALENKDLQDSVTITKLEPNTLIQKIRVKSATSNFSTELLSKIQEKAPKKLLALYYIPTEVAFRYIQSEEFQSKLTFQRIIWYVLIGIIFASSVLLVGLFTNMLLVLMSFLLIYMYMYTVAMFYVSNVMVLFLLILILLGFLLILIISRARAINIYLQESDNELINSVQLD